VTVAFASGGLPDENQEQGDDIFVMSVDRAGRPKSVPRQVTTRHHAETPAVSPDGKRIVWADARDEPKTAASESSLDLWIMNGDGRAQRRLLKGDDERYLGPAWSPTGERIAVLQERSWNSLDFERSVVVFKPDGTGVETLFRVPDNSYDATLSWSADGKRLFVTFYIDDGATRAAQVRSIRVADRYGTTLLAQKPSASYDLVLHRGISSPDGRQLLLRRGLNLFSELRALDLASNRLSDALVADLSTSGSHAWAPEAPRSSLPEAGVLRWTELTSARGRERQWHRPHGRAGRRLGLRSACSPAVCGVDSSPRPISRSACDRH
jgi:hypothetical protein